MTMMQLGEVLLDRGLVDESALLAALDEQAATGAPLGRVLVQRGALAESQLVALLAEQAGMTFVDLDEVAVDRTAVALLPGSVCRQHRILPVGFQDGALLLAMVDPGDLLALDDAHTLTGRTVRPVVAAAAAMDSALNRWVRADSEIADLGQSLVDSVAPGQGGIDLTQVGESISGDTPVVKYVNLLVTQAIADHASDIHVEPTEHDLRVRYRIDGVLQEKQSAPKGIQSSVISRIKVMADIDIAEKRKPQDGRMSVTHEGQKIDLRVATLPTVWGEKIVMRILDNSNAQLDLRDLSFSERSLDTYRASYTKPYGMILVTGPTGSGKSTTLYATVNAVSRPDINVITVEDPVEYRLPGINQVQVNPKAGLTFAAALRSILRSDPDVVLIGEIRDHETAQIAVEASLTGHLVLSTLHTNDAPSSVTRLIEMGIEPFLVGSALDSVVAQRLARKLCDRCKQPYEAGERELFLAGIEHSGPRPVLHRPVGCSACSQTGYRGRIALHEVMSVTEEIERLAVAGASSLEIRSTAVQQGMVTLRDDGWQKICEGRTSLEELLRVVA
jgi:type IV pilus assembly protein PilB